MFELYTHRNGDTTPLKYESISTSYLTVLNESSPANMRFRSISGKNTYKYLVLIQSYEWYFLIGADFDESNFTVFMTDYEAFAVISNCDKENNNDDVQFIRHATIWSRTKNLDDSFVEKVKTHVENTFLRKKCF